ncbi:MAG: hypothetical protein GY809_14330 [Planctomycetes bacterium]|nr:hypothetical protein [Planctomycetota bacterium]
MAGVTITFFTNSTVGKAISAGATDAPGCSGFTVRYQAGSFPGADHVQGPARDDLGPTANVEKQVITTGADAGGAIIKGAGKLGGSIIGGLLPKKKQDANTPQE